MVKVFRARYMGDDQDDNVEKHVTWNYVADFLHQLATSPDVS
jgi:hypothetical protein